MIDELADRRREANPLRQLVERQAEAGFTLSPVELADAVRRTSSTSSAIGRG